MRVAGVGKASGGIRAALPRGGQLPEEAWTSRHRGVLALLWLHSAAIPIFGLVRGYDVAHVLLEALVVPAAAVVAGRSTLARRIRVAAASVGLLSSSAVLVHLSGGVIEMHFHFFVMVAVVALYQDWLPFLASIAYVVIHHGALGALDPQSVYNHPEAWNSPWKWAGIHGFFIAGISAACLVTWRLNETALAQRRTAEGRLREESRVVEMLNEIGRALAVEHDVESVVQRVTDAATSLTPAAFGAFFYNVSDGAGESYLLHALAGAPRDAFSSFPMPRRTAIFGPTFRGEGVVRLDDVTADPRFGTNAPYHGMPPGHLPVRSYLAVPVQTRTGEVLGGLFLGHPEPGRFTATDERLVVGIAAHAAVALDNAQLHESERRARDAAEDAQRNLEVLAEAGRALSSSLELTEILFSLVRTVVPSISDGCAIYVADVEGSVDQVAAEGTGSGLPPNLAPAVVPADALDHPVHRAMSSRAPQLMLPSAIVVPLLRRAHAVGAMVIGNHHGSGRELARDDVALADAIASRAAVAIENAQLYAAQRDVAETLQRSLLPESLPAIPGLSTAARYQPGGPGGQVGGDWFDVFDLPTGEVALAMGDVVGHGVPAASLMGQLRNALRAYALVDAAPAELLRRLNAMLTELGVGDQMATLLYAVYDPDTTSLRIANAGHPPPLLVTPDGDARYLDAESGVPLGAMARARYPESTVYLEAGASLFMYTDGLIERRERSLDEGFEQLRHTIVTGPTELEALCDHVLRSLEGHECTDDVALLALRLVALGPRLSMQLPATPMILRPLRATLRRWLAQAGLDEQETFEILTAAGEACANAVQHGGLTAPTFDVTAELDDVVRITVVDLGGWRAVHTDGGGRGFEIMQQFMDRVDVSKSRRGTRVELVRRIARTPELSGR